MSVLSNPWTDENGLTHPPLLPVQTCPRIRTSSDVAHIFGNNPQRYFVGRDDIMARGRSHISACLSRQTDRSQVYILSGFPGTGKTSTLFHLLIEHLDGGTLVIPITWNHHHECLDESFSPALSASLRILHTQLGNAAMLFETFAKSFKRRLSQEQLESLEIRSVIEVLVGLFKPKNIVIGVDEVLMLANMGKMRVEDVEGFMASFYRLQDRSGKLSF